MFSAPLLDSQPRKLMGIITHLKEQVKKYERLSREDQDQFIKDNEKFYEFAPMRDSDTEMFDLILVKLNRKLNQ